MLLAPVVVLAALAITPAPPRFDAQGRAIGPPLSERTASYVLEARLDPSARRLDGRAVLTWTNRSDVPQRTLWFHAYWNAFRDARSTFAREQAWSGGGRETVSGLRPEERGDLTLTSARLPDGTDLLPTRRWEHPDDDNADDRTVFTLTLPTPVAAHGTLTLELRWTARVPALTARSGVRQGFHFLGQWFPKVGVLEVPPERGVTAPTWNCHQAHATTEYFADFGSYRATLTVPAAMVVGATGVPIGRTENADGTVSHRFHQDDVTDFAWTAWDQFQTVTRVFREEGLPEVQLTALVPRGGEDSAAQLLDATARMLEFGGRRWLPYPYPRLTVVAPPAGAELAAGGMEYATLFTAYQRAAPVLPRDVLLWDVALHETGHAWWQGMLASNEFEEAWLDEGIDTWATARAMDAEGLRWNLADLVPGRLRAVFTPFLRSSMTDWQLRGLALRPRFRTPVALPAWHFPDARAVGRTVYGRAGAALATLEQVAGSERFGLLIRTYAERFAFHHPGTEDFLAVTREVGGAELEALARTLFNDTDGLDDAVSAVRCGHEGTDGGWRCDVDVERAGTLPLSCPLEVRFDDGSVVREELPARSGPWHRFTYRRSGPGARVREARVHPAGAVPLDADPTNDARSREPTLEPLARVSAGFLHAAQLVAAAVGAFL